MRVEEMAFGPKHMILSYLEGAVKQILCSWI